MNFDFSPQTQDYIDRVDAFIRMQIEPNIETNERQHEAGGRWSVPQIVEDLKV